MKRTVYALLALFLVFLAACDGRAEKEDLSRLSSVPPTGASYQVSGLIFDALKGEDSPLRGGRVSFQVVRGDTPVLAGEAVAADDGGFAVAAYMEPGDVLSLEGSVPGYLPSRVYLDVTEIAAGQPVKLGLEAPSLVALDIAGYQWKPTASDPAIAEWADKGAGGLLSVYLRNNAPLPLEIDQLIVDGTEVSRQISARTVRWSRLLPDVIPAGDMAVWELQLTTAPTSVEVAIYPVNAQPAQRSVALMPSPVAVSYITWAQDEEHLDIFVHNQGSGLIQLESVSVNGREVDANIRQQDLGPGETALIIADPQADLHGTGMLHCQVRGRVYQGEQFSAWGTVKSAAPAFPVGTWPDVSELDSAVLDALAKQGIDTLALQLPRSTEDALWQQLGSDDRFRLLAIPRFPANQSQLTAFASQPNILAWFITAEPEYHLARDLFGVFESAKDPGDASEEAWRLGPAFVEAEQAYQQSEGPRTYASLASYDLYAKYAPVPDVAGVVHYAIDAPGANWNGSHALEEVYTYTMGLRDQAAPSPIWPWVQALCSTSWYENTGACWNRLPTPAELRAQLYLELAAGAKGILWYTYQSSFAAQGPEQWAEVRRQNRLLHALRDLLLYGDVADTVSVDQPRVLARAIVSEHAVVVPLVNLDYDWSPSIWKEGEDPPPPSAPYAFHERDSLSFTVLMPEWLQAAAVLSLGPEGSSELEWSSEARALTFSLNKLTDVAMVVVVDNLALAQSLTEAVSP